MNSKDNTLFTTKILLNIDKGNAIKLIINSSTSPIASTLKNIKLIQSLILLVIFQKQ